MTAGKTHIEWCGGSVHSYYDLSDENEIKLNDLALALERGQRERPKDCTDHDCACHAPISTDRYNCCQACRQQPKDTRQFTPCCGIEWMGYDSCPRCQRDLRPKHTVSRCPQCDDTSCPGAWGDTCSYAHGTEPTPKESTSITDQQNRRLGDALVDPRWWSDDEGETLDLSNESKEREYLTELRAAGVPISPVPHARLPDCEQRDEYGHQCGACDWCDQRLCANCDLPRSEHTDHWWCPEGFVVSHWQDSADPRPKQYPNNDCKVCGHYRCSRHT